MKNVTGLLHECLDLIFIYNNINVIRSLFPKNLLKGGDELKRDHNRFIHTRFAVHTYIHTYILYLSCRSVKKEAAKS